MILTLDSLNPNHMNAVYYRKRSLKRWAAILICVLACLYGLQTVATFRETQLQALCHLFCVLYHYLPLPLCCDLDSTWTLLIRGSLGRRSGMYGRRCPARDISSYIRKEICGGNE